MIRFLERAIDRYEAILDVAILGGWHAFVAIACLVVLAGQVRSCVSSAPAAAKPASTEVVPLDTSIESHRKLGEALTKVLQDANPADIQVAVVKSDEINAASMGDSRFILWEGLASLPDSTLDAILAHEISHDRLMHSRKAHDLNDFTLFWSELVGMVGHADFEAAEVIGGWGHDLVMPKYSKAQEFEADDGAIEILRSLGYEHPEDTFADALELLLKRYGDTGGQFEDSHPATSERIRVVRSRSSQ
jgi:Zn-dependent protease with chaperone function